MTDLTAPEAKDDAREQVRELRRFIDDAEAMMGEKPKRARTATKATKKKATAAKQKDVPTIPVAELVKTQFIGIRGEVGQFKYDSYHDGSGTVNVYGGEQGHEKHRAFKADRVIAAKHASKRQASIASFDPDEEFAASDDKALD